MNPEKEEHFPKKNRNLDDLDEDDDDDVMIAWERGGERRGEFHTVQA